jgi:hypothetical protein
MKNRFGGRSKKRIKRGWEEIKTLAAPVEPPIVLSELKYTDIKGIWDLGYTALLPNSGGGGAGPALGLSDSLFNISGTNNAWVQRTVDLGAYAGTTGRFVFKYVSGSSFTGDIQLDLINGTSFENTGNSYQTSSSGETSYESVSWSTLSVGTTNGRWNVNQGGTPSSNTGRTDAAGGSYYVYAETTSPGSPNYTFWLRSPELTAPASFTFYEARNGATIGTLDVYFDRTA